MEKITVNILTKNPGKILAAKEVFKLYNIEVNQIEKNFPEIQAETSLEIARATAIQTAKELGIPIIREDHSLFINALNIPGPYINYIEKRLPVEKLLEILENETDRTGYFEIASVYAEPNGFVLENTYKVPIHFAKKINLPDPHGGWNGVICLGNEEKALTEYPKEERLDVWGKNFIAIAEFLAKKK
jgi:non-canonical purine NTP pyrophosphatase (RdgB/HAM1 family)